MRKALYILGQLNDADVQWLARHGTRRALRDRDIIIRAGQPVDALFITIDGTLVVTLSDGQEVARLGSGEIVGEIAFVDSALPSATVTARGRASVLEVKKALLQGRLQADVGFAARFYRALAIFLADRLRATTRRLGYGAETDLASDQVLRDELDEAILEKVSEAGERFDRLLRMLAADE